ICFAHFHCPPYLCRKSHQELAEVRFQSKSLRLLISFLSASQLVTTTLRRDSTSYFSLCPLDLLEYLVAPMVKNMRGFKMPSTDAAELGADAQLHASAAVPGPVVKSQ